MTNQTLPPNSFAAAIQENDVRRWKRFTKGVLFVLVTPIVAVAAFLFLFKWLS